MDEDVSAPPLKTNHIYCNTTSPIPLWLFSSVFEIKVDTYTWVGHPISTYSDKQGAYLPLRTVVLPAKTTNGP